jgi:hypothetical protein
MIKRILFGLSLLVAAAVAAHAQGFPGVFPPNTVYCNDSTAAASPRTCSYPLANVKDSAYGAKGDGTTDDTTAIQNAINSLPVTGGDVVFPCGSYKVTSTVTLGNGTSSTASTRYGMILRGVGDSQMQPTFAGFNTTACVRILWAGSGSGGALSVNGPLMTWGIQNLEVDCNSVASAIGIKVTSATLGDVRNVALINCPNVGLLSTTFPLFGSFTNTGSFHNKYYGVSVMMPASAGAIGIHLTGDGTQDTFFNTFWSTNVFLPTSVVAVTGIQLQATDTDAFYTTHVYGGNASATSVKFDYSVNSAWPSGVTFSELDPAQAGGGASFANNGTPSNANARSNYVFPLAEVNNATCPTLANLTCYSSHLVQMSAGGNNGIAQFASDLKGNFGFKGTAPTLTAGCNGAGSSVTGNNQGGTVVGQTAAATTCTLTFAGTGFSVEPACIVAGESGAISNYITSNTTLVVNFPSTGGFAFKYVCPSIN